MPPLNFYIVDVFAREKYTGNQLAVFTGAGFLSGMEMQKIAREMNYSETTFILSNEVRNGGYDVRIFTPQKEIPFAGHPTLGTAYIIQLCGNTEPTIKLNLPAGQISVSCQASDRLGDILWMRQPEPSFGQTISPQEIAPILNLAPEAIDRRFPVQEVSTGLPFIIVPLRSRLAVQQAKVNQERLFALIEHAEAKAILIFCPEPYEPENDLNARAFVDYFGIPEDPATGSANGCLAAYLCQHSYWGKSAIDARVEQGYEINRPSLLLLKAQKQGESIEVQVGGTTILVAQGQFV